MTIRAILFDKDGTLLDFDATFGPAGWHILNDLAGGDGGLLNALAEVAGYDLDTRRFAHDSAFIADPTEIYGPGWAAVLDRPCDSEFCALVDRLTTHYAMSSLTPFGDVDETLAELAGRGLPLGVATNDTEESAREQIAALGLDGHLTFVVGYDSGHGAKPGPGMVHAFSGHTGVPPAEIAMVGDSLRDLQCARAAGAVAIAVTTGLAAAETLAAHADHVIGRLGDVIHLV